MAAAAAEAQSSMYPRSWRRRRISASSSGAAPFVAAGVKLAGATLFICDSGVDTGPIIAQCAVPVEDDDTVDTLTERIKEAERAQLVASVGRMVKGGWKIEGRRVRLG